MLKMLKIEKLKERPKEIKPVYLEAILMPNGEIIFEGKSLTGFKPNLKYIYTELKNEKKNND